MPRTIASIALLAAVLALALAVYAASRTASAPDESAIEKRVYQRIVSELRRELAPAYEDFGIHFEREPETVGELMRPLLSVEQKLRDQP